MSNRAVYRFGDGRADGRASDKALLGGKGANLAEMTSLGIPVPPGFTITTDVCRAVLAKHAGATNVEHASDHSFAHEFDVKTDGPATLVADVDAALAEVGTLTGTVFGDANNPLLVSVRSGAPASMPGMMDTILNLGLNDTTVAGLAARTNNPRFAWDCYRRFIGMYGEVVLGIDAPDEHSPVPFERILEDRKNARNIRRDSDLNVDDLKFIVEESKKAILAETGKPFPDDVHDQLWGAIAAVFRSWGNPRADVYRRMQNIPFSMGTAVNVQAMVFGNMGDDCATGVAFTRDPSTGQPGLFGEFLLNAQGEDVVAGVRTPTPIGDLASKMPEAHKALTDVSERLENHFADLQDIEFTIQNRKLWMLQTRGGKRSGRAMIRVAVDMVAEGKLTPKQAVLRIDPAKLDEVLHPTIDPKARPAAVAKGLPASPGAAIGAIVFSATQAEAAKKKGDAVILVRTETSPEDIVGMKSSVGILTARGGMTSHAAVVARGMGICCVTACSGLRVDAARGTATINSGGKETTLKGGDIITLDGSTGEVFLGAAALAPAEIGPELDKLMAWVDEFRRLKVRTNADTPIDARTARSFGAEGIGLCRTEHMFFAPERLLAMRQMIVAKDEAGRRAALSTILPMQRGDFAELFRVMDGLPVTIRLLDPPLHEFLPHSASEIAAVAESLGQPVEVITAKVAELTESNPMLGHRGCRLAVTFPEIYEIQAQAIAEAAALVAKEGIKVAPEIMIPLVMIEGELALLRALVTRIVDASLAAAGQKVAYTIGTMIELPRACVVADRIAAHADFFSFGTNDLTQTTFGLSRDDAGRFLPAYIEGELLSIDPFVSVDQDGVGALIKVGVAGGRRTRPGLKIGVCGEHGGDPESVGFFHRAGFDYVSCSPFRVPIARVAAARAAQLEEAKP